MSLHSSIFMPKIMASLRARGSATKLLFDQRPPCCKRIAFCKQPSAAIHFLAEKKKFHLTNNSHKNSVYAETSWTFLQRKMKKKTKTYNIIIIFCIHFVRSSQFFFMLRLCCCIPTFDSFYFISCTRHWSEWMDQWFRGRIIKWMKPAAQNGELSQRWQEKKLRWKCNFKFA